MATNERIGLEAVLEDADFNKGVAKYMDNVGDMEKKSVNVGAAIGKAFAVGGAVALAGIAAVTAGLVDATKAAAQEEQGILKLGAAVTASGGDWKSAQGAIESYLAAELKRTALDDGAGRESISRLTTATGDYRKALELMPLVQDLARAKGMDLAAASEIVGKVYAGNLGTLSRYGIVLEDGATAASALAEMQRRFAGQAEAYGDSLTGSTEKMQIAFGNFKETIGAAVIPIIMSLYEQFGPQLLSFLERAANWILSNFIPVVASVGDTIAALVRVFQGSPGAVLGLKVALSDLFGFSMEQFDAWSATATGAFSAVKDTIMAVVDFALPYLTAGLDMLQSIWTPIWQDLQNTAELVWFNIEDTITMFVDQVLPILTRELGFVVDWVQDNWPKIRDTFLVVWTAIDEIAQLVIGVFVPYIIAAFSQVLAWVDANWPRIQAVIEKVFNAILTVVQAVVGTIAPFIVEKFDMIREWVDENWPLIQRTIETVLNGILGTVETVMNAVSGFWEENGEAIMRVLNGVWMVISGVIDAALHLVLGIVKTVMQIITGDWEGAWTTIKDTAVAVWEDIKQIIGGYLQILKGLFDVIYPAIKAAWEGFWNSLKNAATSVWAGIAAGINTGLANVQAAIQAVVDKLLAGLDSLPDKFRTIGERIVQGLVGGIEAFIGDVAGVIQRLLGSLPDWAKKLLGISSPSKVFEDIGQAVGEGLVVGIESTFGDVQTAAGGLGNALVMGALPTMADVNDAFLTIMRDLAQMVRDMKGILEHTGVGETEYKLISGFFQIIERIADMMTKTVEVLKEAIGKSLDVSGIAAKVNEFYTSLRPAIKKMMDFAGEWGLAQIAQAKASADMLITLLDSFTSVLDMGERLAEYKGVDLGTLVSKFATLTDQTRAIVQMIVDVSARLGAGTSIAALFASKVILIMQSVGSMVEAVTAIGSWEPVKDFATRATQFFVDAGQMVTQLVAFAGRWPEGVESIKGLSSLVGHVANLAEAIKAIGAWKPIEDFAAKMTTFLADAGQMVAALVTFAGQWPKGVTAIDGLNELVGHVSSLVDAISAVGEYEAIKDFASKITAMLADAGIMIRDLVAFAAKAPAGVAAAGLVMTAIGAIVAPIKNAVDALKALGAYVAIVNVQAVVGAFMSDLFEVASALGMFANNFNLVATKAAGEVVAAVGALLTPLRNAVDALKALGTYTRIEDAQATVSAFLNDLFDVVQQIGPFASNFETKAIQAAALVWAAINSLVTPIKNAVGTLAALGDYTKIDDAQGKVLAFTSDLFDVIQQLIPFVGNFETEGVKAATLVMEAVAKLMAPIKSAVDGLTALGTYTHIDDAQARVLAFTNDLFDVIQQLGPFAGNFETEAVKIATAMLDAVSKLVAPLKQAVDGLAALGDYKGIVSVQAVTQRFVADLLAVIAELSTLAIDMSAEGIAAAMKIMTAASSMASAIKGSVDALNALGTYVPVKDLPAKINMLMVSLKYAVDAIVAVAQTQAPAIWEAAGKFATAVAPAVTLLKLSVEALAAVATFSTEYITPKKFEVMADIIRYAVEMIAWVSYQVAPVALKAASVFALEAADIFKFMKEALDFLGSLNDATLPNEAKIAAFIATLQRILGAFTVGVAASAGIARSAVAIANNMGAAQGIWAEETPTPTEYPMPKIDWGGIIGGKPTPPGGGGGGGGGTGGGKKGTGIIPDLLGQILDVERYIADAIGGALGIAPFSASANGRVSSVGGGAGGGTTIVNNYNLSASYANVESEGRLSDTLRLLRVGAM